MNSKARLISLDANPDITELELFAIKEGIHFARQVVTDHPQRRYDWVERLTDCTEALKCLFGPPRQNTTAHAIKQKCEELRADSGVLVTVLWIRGHKGHLGNEKAHELASEASLHRFQFMLPVGPYTLLTDPDVERRHIRNRRR